MTRSPLAYPLNRAADTDVGGASDLQTDIMRFMAILALCLVAIFALVQSMPLAPVVKQPPQQQTPADPEPSPQTEAVPRTQPEPAAAATKVTVRRPAARTTVPTPRPESTPNVVLQRPKWTPQSPPKRQLPASLPTPAREPDQVLETPAVVATPAPPAVPDREGFTLRFESDTALTRLVAANQIGVYAIDGNRAQRMTVSESRISFWDASTPNSFHEMETTTVPDTVIDALSRSGTDAQLVNWGVTLPGKLRRQLDGLMQEHAGGALVIAASGNIHWEQP